MTVVTAVGDLMLGDSAATVGFGLRSRYRGARIEVALQALRPILQGADVAFGNLECILSDRGLGSSRLERDQMRGDPEYAGVLRNVGFNAIGVANNHAVQHGVQAFHETVAHLRVAGIAAVGVRGENGWCCNPVRITSRSSMVTGLLGYCARPRQYSLVEPPFAEAALEDIERDVRRLRRETDNVVVSLHWGEEFVSSPSIEEAAFAARVLDAGASTILGHHPHVCRPVAISPQGVVAYSLGNAVSDMLWMRELRQGLAIRLRLQSEVPEVDVLGLLTDDAFCVDVQGDWKRPDLDGSSPLDSDSYALAVRSGLRQQRGALYRFVLKNIHRYPIDVAAQLFLRTAGNKLAESRGR